MTRALEERELSILKETVSSFIQDEVLKQEQELKKYYHELPEESARLLREKAKSSGLAAFGAKKEWGGAGLSLYERTVIYEEASKHRYGMYYPAGGAFGEEYPSFLQECTPEQIEKYVKPAVQEGKGCFLALWEEKEDQNMQNLSCEAQKDGNGWIINGEKSYVQKMENSFFGVVLVHCLSEDGERKPTLFILEHNDPFEQKETRLIDVQKTNTLVFNEFRIDDSRRIGAVGDGEKLVSQYIAESQVLLGARCLGIAYKAIDYAKAYAKMRITRGKPLAEFPSIRTMIADGILNLQAARLMVADAAKKLDKRERDGLMAAKMAKVFAVDTAAKIIDDAFQIHGGSGFAGDLPIERWYKEIRLARLDLQKREAVIEEIAKQNLN